MADFAALSAAYDGPIPPAERAAARWGAGAWERLRRGADEPLIEVRLRECAAAMARLRLAGPMSGAVLGVLQRLARRVAHYRRAAATNLAAG